MEKTDYQYKIILSIKSIREDHNLTQAGLADILDVPDGLIGNIESTKFRHKYTLSQLKKACDYFEIRIETLFLDNIQAINEDLIDNLITKIIQYEQR